VGEGVSQVVRQLLGVVAPWTRLVLALELLVFGLMVAADHRLPIGIGGSEPFRMSTLLRFGAMGLRSEATEPWRYLSAVFVHMGVLHVGMNLWMFTDLGARLERELGGARAALIFLVTGVLGFVASEIWYAPLSLLTAGASGGVFGQIGAEVGILRARRDPEWRRSLIRNLVYALVLSLALRGVNNAAHIGGFAAGIALGYAFEVERRRWSLDRLLRAVAVIFVVAAVGSVLLSTHSSFWQLIRARELMTE
jgi:membrane associated rhomboid family serine protease